MQQLTPLKHYKFKYQSMWYVGQLDDIGYLHQIAQCAEENGTFVQSEVSEPIATGDVDIIICKEVDVSIAQQQNNLF